MTLYTAPYLYQSAQWPKAGRHILCRYDEEIVVVYQAFSPEIGHYAAEHGAFGDGFSLERMSWIKTSFLWLMYRSGWGTKENQEVTLAIHLKRAAFDEILRLAVHSSFVPTLYETEADWKHALQQAEVRLQWDPDHDPSGAKLERRAIQLGLRGTVLERYVKDWIVHIEDISEFVAAQYNHVQAQAYDDLITPQEWVYWINDSHLKERLGVATSNYGLMTPIEELGLTERCVYMLRRSAVTSIEDLVELFDGLFDEHGYPTGTFNLPWMFCFDQVEDALKIGGYYSRKG